MFLSQQTNNLQNQVAKLQSLLERNEAEKQKLEYSLALAQREGRQNEDVLEEKEREFESIQSSLQRKRTVQSLMLLNLNGIHGLCVQCYLGSTLECCSYLFCVTSYPR